MRQRLLRGIVLLLLGTCIPPVWADEGTPQIHSVEISGNRTVNETAILSKVKTRSGTALSQRELDEDLKRLYATGFFTDVQVDVEETPDGSRVVFRVTEKPVIEKIQFKNNKAIPEKKLLATMKVKPKEFLDQSRLRQDMLLLKQEYEKKGFARAAFDLKTDVNTDNQAAVTLEVTEGPRVRIKKITMDGNQAFSDKRLLKLLKTKKDTLFTSGFFKEEVIQEDGERLEAFYKSEGFLDAAVRSRLTYNPSGKEAYLAFTIDEGRKYLTGTIALSGTVIFPEGEIRKTLKMREGETFSREHLRQDIANIQGYYFERGYINAEINAETALEEELGTIDISYEIKENELTYIRDVVIRGNQRTRDVVVRRELRVVPGEAFDGAKIKRSRERLLNLGFFDEVSFDTEPTNKPNQSDLIVDVKEKKTGEFSFGAGFSSLDRFVGFIEVAQKNFDWQHPPAFVGDGQDLRLRTQFGTTRQDYELSWTEPWIFDRPISFGFDLFRRERDRSGTSGFSYDEKRTGGDVRLGKAFGEYNRANLIYKLEEVQISDISPTASAALLAEAGKNTVSSAGLTLTRDTRDSVFSPAHGYVASLAGILAGGPLGFDRDFTRYFFRGDSYWTPFRPAQVLSVGGRAGIVSEFGNTAAVPIFERFFAGGSNTIRGYDERDVGPKDAVSGDPIGGEAVLVGNVEYTFPIIEILRGAVFFDAGGIWPEATDIGQGNYRYGTGVGVRVKTPVGPVSIDYGYPLNPDSTQSNQGRFHFNISRSF